MIISGVVSHPRVQTSNPVGGIMPKDWSRIKVLGKAAGWSFLFALIEYAALYGNVYAFQKAPSWTVSCWLGAILAVWSLFHLYNVLDVRMAELAYALKVVCSVLLITWAVPAFILYLVLNQGSYKRGIQIATFMVSTGIGILYYLRNKEKFPGAADKVTYFCGVCLGPATVVTLLL
jgi:hypothetical protein